MFVSRRRAIAFLLLLGAIGAGIAAGVTGRDSSTAPSSTTPPRISTVTSQLPDGSSVSYHRHIYDARSRTATAQTAAASASALITSSGVPIPARSTSVACVPRGTKNAYRVYYTRPSDRPSRYAATVPKIRTTVAQVSAYLDAAAKRMGGTGGRLRVWCEGSQVSVDDIFMPLTTKAIEANWYAPWDIMSSYTFDTNNHSLVFIDDPAQYGGLGGVKNTGVKSTSNPQNGFSMAMVYNTPYITAVHEVLHSMGALIHDRSRPGRGMPNASEGGHCRDGVDVMCRGSDGTPGSTPFSMNCPRTVFGNPEEFELDGVVDCDGNDYFNPNPRPGSYLANNFNLAGSENVYLDRTPTPDVDPPVFTYLDVSPTGFVDVDVWDLVRVTSLRITGPGVDAMAPSLPDMWMGGNLELPQINVSAFHGRRDYTLTASDRAGNVATTSFSLVGTLDVVPPVGGSVSYPGGPTRASSISVSFVVGSDADSGIDRWQLHRQQATYAGGSCRAFSTWAPIGTVRPSSPFSDATTVHGTCYRYGLQVTDNAGNAAMFDLSDVHVMEDRVAPSVRRALIDRDVATIEAVDDTCCVSAAVVTWTGGSVALQPQGSGVWTASVPSVSTYAGPRTYSLRVEDAAGNVRTQPLQTVRGLLHISCTISAWQRRIVVNLPTQHRDLRPAVDIQYTYTSGGQTRTAWTNRRANSQGVIVIDRALGTVRQAQVLQAMVDGRSISSCST